MKYLVIVFILMSYNLAFSQSRVEMNDGTEFIGIIKKVKNDTLILKTMDDFEIALAKNDIYEIYDEEIIIKTVSGEEYQVHILDDSGDTYKVKSGASIFEMPKDRILFINSGKLANSKKDYMIFGATAFLPGGINLIGGYRFDFIGLRAEFGTIPGEIWGIQGNIDLLLHKKANFEHGFSLAFGYSEDGSSYYNHWYRYIGPTYFLNIYGFFLEPGICFGEGTYSSPQFFLQAGYVYRFN